MRNRKKPSKFARLLSKTTGYYGIELIYCNPTDVKIEEGIIHGKILKNNKWENKTVPIPPFIDVNTYCFKYKEEMNFLNQKSLLSSYGRFGTKEKVYQMLENDGEFKHILIPSQSIKTFEEFHSFLNNHKQIIVKPKNGQKGKGIYLFSIEKDSYIISFDNQENTVSSMDLKGFFQDNIQPRNYVFQKYIESKSEAGDPFDCRIRLEKNGNGEWSVPIYLVRIGTNQKVVSNVAQGGSVSTLTPFLKANYGENWKEIRDSIKRIGKTLPYKIEKLSKQATSMGIDIGINKQGELYLFEVNSAPGVEFGTGEIASIKADYYDYILNKISYQQVRDKEMLYS